MRNNPASYHEELPGTAQVPPPPHEEFEELLRRRGPGYRPRTKHLRPDGAPRYTNRLFLQSSPYLLQHAHNPVNWFPWGDEAFELARRLDRPVLVSIGYATCHWCHVMEEESFEDLEIARCLNSYFIAVKVDREERPDLDSIYMNALHATGAQGGWPLNVFLTPDRRPFYGGTYFPPRDHSRGLGFLSLLIRLHEAYRRDRDRVAEVGRQLTETVRAMLASSGSGEVPAQQSLELAEAWFRERFDPVHGGLSGAPKFPSSLPVRLLLRRFRATGDRELLSMAELTLRRMAAGGICDQIAGGFHRYATDEAWLAPHFEKMLYDNALLVLSYLEGYQVTGDPEHARVAREVLQYLRREMVAPEGGFYAATDADSPADTGERKEGAFFTWTPTELERELPAEQAAVVAAFYGISAAGNFEGRSIPHRGVSLAQVAAALKVPLEQVKETIEQSREILYQARQRRPQPLRDEKLLASWNGLALSAFARAGLLLDDAVALTQARSTAGFLVERMISGGRLAHSHQEGESKGEGFLDDYACVTAGLIDLFEATAELRWLEQALGMAEVVQHDFSDGSAGGYFLTGSQHEELIAREKPAQDGPVPSGNSVMILNLLRLHLLTGRDVFRERAKQALQAFAPLLASAPIAVAEMLLALDFLLDSPREIVIVAPRDRPEAAQRLLSRLRGVFLPNRALVVACEGEEMERASTVVPLLRDKRAEGDQAVAYLCEGKSCRRPTSDPEEFFRQLTGSGE